MLGVYIYILSGMGAVVDIVVDSCVVIDSVLCFMLVLVVVAYLCLCWHCGLYCE